MNEIEVSKNSIPAISHGPFMATPYGLEIEDGKPVPYETWEAYGKGLQRIEGAIQWVIGDWLRFGEFNYGEKYAQATDAWPETKQQQLANYQWVSNAYLYGERSVRTELSWSHFERAASLEEPLRSQLLDEANEKEWSVRDLKQAIRAHQIGEIKESEIVVPEGKFNVIACDPPWPYDLIGSRNPWETYDRAGRRASAPYNEMTLPQIIANEPPAADDCILWLWTTHRFMGDALSIIKLWGFTHKAIVTWIKDQMGLGSWLRSKSEFCIMAIKGKPKVALENQTTVMEGPLREHSRKPDSFYELVESLVPNSYRKLDMYSREKREGWDQLGNEPKKF